MIPHLLTLNQVCGLRIIASEHASSSALLLSSVLPRNVGLSVTVHSMCWGALACPPVLNSNNSQVFVRAHATNISNLFLTQFTFTDDLAVASLCENPRRLCADVLSTSEQCAGQCALHINHPVVVSRVRTREMDVSVADEEVWLSSVFDAEGTLFAPPRIHTISSLHRILRESKQA
eukprot:PhM_4_TR17155/c0_g1_i1/m.21989